MGNEDNVCFGGRHKEKWNGGHRRPNRTWCSFAQDGIFHLNRLWRNPVTLETFRTGGRGCGKRDKDTVAARTADTSKEVGAGGLFLLFCFFPFLCFSQFSFSAIFFSFERLVDRPQESGRNLLVRGFGRCDPVGNPTWATGGSIHGKLHVARRTEAFWKAVPREEKHSTLRIALAPGFFMIHSSS